MRYPLSVREQLIHLHTGDAIIAPVGTTERRLRGALEEGRIAVACSHEYDQLYGRDSENIG